MAERLQHTLASRFWDFEQGTPSPALLHTRRFSRGRYHYAHYTAARALHGRGEMIIFTDDAAEADDARHFSSVASRRRHANDARRHARDYCSQHFTHAATAFLLTMMPHDAI